MLSQAVIRDGVALAARLTRTREVSEHLACQRVRVQARQGHRFWRCGSSEISHSITSSVSAVPLQTRVRSGRTRGGRSANKKEPLRKRLFVFACTVVSETGN